MKRILTSFAILLLLAACSPKATPAIVPSPTPARTVQAAAPAQTPEETAWQKVVSEARKEGQVTLYAGSVNGSIAIDLAATIKEKYGITLEIITGRGNEQIERLKTEQRVSNVVADVVESSSLNVVTAKEVGVVQAPGDLPVLKEKNVWLMGPGLDPENTVFSYIASPILVWANTRMKPEDEPRAWKDLLDPRWKSKMIMADPLVSSGPYLAFVPLLNSKAIDEPYLTALGNQDIALEVGSTSEVVRKLGAGQYLLSLAISSATAGPLIKEGLPIRPIDMAEGVGVSGLGIAMVKKAPHQNAARLFLNWALSAEGQARLSQLLSAPGVRSDVPDFSVSGARIKPKRLIPLRMQDMADESRLSQGKYLAQFFKKAK